VSLQLADAICFMFNKKFTSATFVIDKIDSLFFPDETFNVNFEVNNSLSKISVNYLQIDLVRCA